MPLKSALRRRFRPFVERELRPLLDEWRFYVREFQPVLNDVKEFAKTYAQRAPNGDVPEVLRKQWTLARAQLVHVEDRYQRAMKTKVDPLFRGERHALLQKMDAGNAQETEITPEERDINRTLALSGVITVAAIVTAPMAPIVGFAATVPLAAYVIRWGIKQAYTSVVEEHRLSMQVLLVVNQGLLWLGGHYLIGGVIFILATTGRKIGYSSQMRSSKELANVFGKLPSTVWVLKDGVELEIAFDQLNVGDTLVLTPGQIIPIDGKIVEGFASVDQHRLTGESQPADKQTGDEVLASTVVLAGRVLVRVEKAGHQTVAAQIGEMLRKTASYEMSITTQARQMADRSVAPTLIAAGVAGLMLGGSSAIAITSTVFGLNLLFSGPLALRNYLLVAARQNILIKDGRSMDLLAEIDTVVFDKTGTLTLEQPRVAQVYSFGGLGAEGILGNAAAAEYRQTHPIARAILHSAHERGLEIPEIDDASYEVGYGLRASVQGRLVRVGSERFMLTEGIVVPVEAREAKESCHDRGNSLVLLALDSQLAGAIELEPAVRPELQEVFKQLQARQLEFCIISGDQERPTRALAESLGIARYFANTLPENKAKLVEELQAQGRKVCFIGDGINDSIALKKANVSISLRGATSVAMDTAQIVFMDSTLRHLPTLFQLAGEMKSNLQTAQALAIVPAACIWLGVFFAHLQILGANVIFEASLWAGIANAMRPLVKYKNASEDPVPADKREASLPLQIALASEGA